MNYVESGAPLSVAFSRENLDAPLRSNAKEDIYAQKGVFKLTQLLVEILDAKLRIGDIVIVVGDPRRLAFLRKPRFVVGLSI